MMHASKLYFRRQRASSLYWYIVSRAPAISLLQLALSAESYV